MTNAIYSGEEKRRVEEPTKVQDVKAETRIGWTIIMQTVVIASILGMGGVIIAFGGGFASKVLDELKGLNKSFVEIRVEFVKNNTSAELRDKAVNLRFDMTDKRIDSISKNVEKNSESINKILIDRD